MLKRLSLCALTAALLTACQSGPSPLTLVNIAASRDPEAALRGALKHRAELYERDPRVLLADLRAAKRDFSRLQAFLSGKARASWGPKEVKLPSRTRYVKYTQNYRSRAVVDFDTGEITVETVDRQEPGASLKNAIITTLLTPDDPRAVDLYSDKSVALTSSSQPYLLGLVLDREGKPIDSPAQAERFADYLLRARSATRDVKLRGGVAKALFVKIRMTPNFESSQARKYRPLVQRFAAQNNVSSSLVFAIIRTESNFNPFAVSPAPAYGMMQLVPASGGRAAYRRISGRDEMPTREFLFDAANNIELGTAYLALLSQDQLDVVANPVSREYCVISAYNTGPGNVLRAFAADRVAAVNRINAMQPPAVYDRLRRHLPYRETRRYLVKVVEFRREFLSFEN
ncbi:MAG TPA: murein transglycosylase domain-containing protein [Burkholderiales bacterium]|nr:murein transglycosylase domain-containing protein [Burkholderiales bacterium]